MAREGTAEQKQNASGALWDLAINADYHVKIAEAGGIGPLVSMADDGTEEQKENAAAALWNLAVNGDNQVKIVVAGGIAPLEA